MILVFGFFMVLLDFEGVWGIEVEDFDWGWRLVLCIGFVVNFLRVVLGRISNCIEYGFYSLVCFVDYRRRFSEDIL